MCCFIDIYAKRAPDPCRMHKTGGKEEFQRSLKKCCGDVTFNLLQTPANTHVKLRQNKARKSLVWKVRQTCTGIRTSVTSAAQRSVNSFAHSRWVATPQHAHVQRTSSRHAFPSRRHRLDRPGTEQFRGGALLPSSHHPRSIPACPMLARSFLLPPAALLASISINKK